MSKSTNDVSMSKLTSLKDAINYAPNQMGCYQLYKNGKLIYVGKAEDGIRKRLVQYYNGTTTEYTSVAIINLWKDELQVRWIVLDSKEAVLGWESNCIGELKPLLNTQSGWGQTNQLKGTTVGNAINVMSPEMAIADCIGGATKTAIKGAVAVTAGVEAIKSLANGDSIEECLGNVASKSCEAAVSAGAGAVAGEVAGVAAVALGAGPIGMGVATLAAAVAVGSAAAECAD